MSSAAVSRQSPEEPAERVEEGAQMSEWEKEIGAMTLFVRDLGRTKTFYQEVFGLPALGEEEDSVMFRFKNILVFLHKDPAGPEQPAGAVLGEALKGAGQFAIIVDDVDAVCAELDKRGVELLSGPVNRDWGMRTVTFADPAGYIWEIAQEMPGGDGS
jgi:catechol 2,3-dioxygenase-like lactoylglutathione lyase family enzyme